jgi:hypothetical protein
MPNCSLSQGILRKAFGCSGCCFTRGSLKGSEKYREHKFPTAGRQICWKKRLAADVITSSMCAAYDVTGHQPVPIFPILVSVHTETGLSHPSLDIYTFSLPLLPALSVPQPQSIHTFTPSYITPTRPSSVHPTRTPTPLHPPALRLEEGTGTLWERAVHLPLTLSCMAYCPPCEATGMYSVLNKRLDPFDIDEEDGCIWEHIYGPCLLLFL